ncbi:hypothetical protein ACP4OV_017370 [Aristida adscensionis]
MGSSSWVGDAVPVVVMLGLNVVAAVMVSLVKVAMDGGMDPLVLVTLQQLTASLFLAPISYIKERKTRPKLTLEILGYLFVSAALGAALRQYMIFVALRYTTATFVTAFSNIAPVLTFLLAVATRSEALNLRSKTGVAKLAGTLVSVGGAMVLTLYRGAALTRAAAPPRGLRHGGHEAAANAAGHGKWTLGTVAILGNCVCLSCWFLLQGRLARKYPHVYSSNAFMSAFSFLQVALVGLSTHRTIAPWIIRSKFQILTVLYAGIVGCGVSFVLLTWCIEKRGPVFVAAFIPVVQIIVLIIDFSILHEQLYLGSVLGSVLVVGGLYMLLWGKRQEALQRPSKPADDADKEQQQVQL